ncbi:MAG: hypothetical protein TREMPRED_005015 [Tremellales sp. Tagirdzhanova-0007]|nr:MAG: hypothetical protein TREMPRED_005015 [Tremellales sp. Tagirdzhanova-0007]
MSSFAQPGLKFNYSLYAAPAAWVIAMSPLWWATAVSSQASPGAYNNAMPKESWENLKGKVDDKLYGRVTRAIAANINSHTGLPFFAAGLVAGNVAHLDSSTLHYCAASYLISRITYNLAYILIEDPTWSFLRSALYWSGIVSTCTLFVKAADRWKSLPW